MVMNYHSSSSLNEIIKEAQKIEEILYRRHKEQRAHALLKTKNMTKNSAIPSLFAKPSRRL